MVSADSVVAPVVDHVPSSEETEPFETNEAAATPPSPPACRTTARISIRPEAPVLLPPEEEVERLLALPTPPPSPLTSLSPPYAKEHLARCLAAPALPSSPLPRLPHPYGSPNHVRAPPGFRAAMGRLRASSPLPPPVPATLPLPPLPSSPLPPLPDSLFIPPVDRKEDILEAELPPHKRFIWICRHPGSEAKIDREPRHRLRIRDTFGRPRRLPNEGALVTTRGVNTGLDMGFSLAVHYELQGYRTHVWTQDHRMDAQDSLIVALTAQVSLLQGHLATALGVIRALQAREQACADIPEGSGSSS
ncbi:hypothetical protein Tco_0251364 [Tanacetum coccineum]